MARASATRRCTTTNSTGCGCIPCRRIRRASAGNRSIPNPESQTPTQLLGCGIWLVSWDFRTKAENQPKTQRMAFWSRSRRQDDKHDQLSCSHRQFATVEKQHAFALDDLINLVHSLVGMQSVKLAHFEAIQTDEQSRRLEDGRLGHLVGTPNRMVGWPNYGRVVHL